MAFLMEADDTPRRMRMSMAMPLPSSTMPISKCSVETDRYLGFDHKIKLDVELPTVQFKGKHECGRCELGEREAGERIHDWNLVEQGLTEEEARQEASRCLRCDHFGFGAFRGGRNLEW